MKRIILLVACMGGILFSQTATVTVKGAGPNRAAAVKNAQRAAVEQAFGTHVQSWTEVQNFKVLEDVIRTKAEGYITSSTVIDETPFPDRYEVTITATVSLSPMQADAKSLTQRFGGVRFLAYFDKAKAKCPVEDIPRMEYAADRINEYLSTKGYRYVEPTVLERMIADAPTGSDPCALLTREQEIANGSKAEFYFHISNLRVNLYKRTGVTGTLPTAYLADVVLDLKLYDAGTGEGVTNATANVSLDETDIEGVASWTSDEAWRKAIDMAVVDACDKIMYRLAERMGDWVNNGYPYQLRFYGASYDPVDDLILELESDSRFGGQMDIRTEPACGYIDVNLTFLGAPQECGRLVRGKAREVPAISNIETAAFIFNRLVYSVNNASVPQTRIAPR